MLFQSRSIYSLLSISRLYPIFWVLQYFLQISFRCSLRSQSSHIFPSSSLRQTDESARSYSCGQREENKKSSPHQDALYSRSGRHQSKLRPSIINQIKLDISSPSNELPSSLFFSPLPIFILKYDRHIRW